MNEYFRQPDNASMTVKITLEKIYTKYLKDFNAPKTISMNPINTNSNVGINDAIVARNEASVPFDATVNTGRMSREDIDQHQKHSHNKRVSFNRKKRSHPPEEPINSG